MHKWTIIFSILFCAHVFAESCPSINNIKANHLHGWKIEDSEDGRALTRVRLKYFVDKASSWTMAEWSRKNIHCHYSDRNGSDLEVYLTRNNVGMRKPNHFWYPVTGSYNCAAGINNCQFRFDSRKTFARN